MAVSQDAINAAKDAYGGWIGRCATVSEVAQLHMTHNPIFLQLVSIIAEHMEAFAREKAIKGRSLQ
ncbi:MAG TPA: hypothetical protein VG271_02285 [Beijerinckiaceae bacterium]|jgi:hypothetical protein|nr:hypothetical protein [Beijerinckiaceae bacterium]